MRDQLENLRASNMQRRALGEKVADAIRPHVDELFLLGQGGVPRALTSLPLIDDAPQLYGPMAALIAALRARPDAAWIVCA